MPSQPSQAQARLGELLVRRRIELDPRYRNRRTFVDERAPGLYRIINDAELGRRSNFELGTIAALEDAYSLEAGSLKRALDGGDLAPAAPASTPARHGINWPIPPREGTPFTNESLSAAEPFAHEPYARLSDLQRQGVTRPSGDQVYPLDERQAGGYDAALAAGYSPEAAVEVAATVQGQAERARREQHRDRSGTRGA